MDNTETLQVVADYVQRVKQAHNFSDEAVDTHIFTNKSDAMHWSGFWWRDAKVGKPFTDYIALFHTEAGSDTIHRVDLTLKMPPKKWITLEALPQSATTLHFACKAAAGVPDPNARGYGGKWVKYLTVTKVN